MKQINVMKQALAIFALLVVAGCASHHSDTPNTADSQAWQSYGEQTAAKGLVEHSQHQLAKSSANLTDEAYMAYQKGYAIGQKQYCSQNASWLGSTGQAYRGICDNIDPFFRQDYMAGVQSHAGGM